METTDLAVINRWYNHGIRYLEASMGIELTIIEKARFRALVKDSIRRNDEFENPHNRFCLGQEAIAIFLHDNYRVPYPTEDSCNWLIDIKSLLRKNGFDGSEYWRKIQEESHLV